MPMLRILANSYKYILRRKFLNRSGSGSAGSPALKKNGVQQDLTRWTRSEQRKVKVGEKDFRIEMHHIIEP
jgi:hypothetical protein